MNRRKMLWVAAAAGAALLAGCSGGSKFVGFWGAPKENSYTEIRHVSGDEYEVRFVFERHFGGARRSTHKVK